ncbi:MAG: endonuclease/exonuclease/phosphatase family protein [Anaerolineae bacterium]|nr:endonuclease/exonuclease/phosphatase family protein [Anaerolineae bacterium]
MKIITLNLRHNNDRWEERFPLVVDCLHTHQADVIGLQEVHIPIRQAHIIAEALNQRTPQQPYSVLVEPKWGDTESHEGVGLLTRLPVLEHARLDLPLAERVAQRITLEVDGRRIHIANTHLHHRPIHDESIRQPQIDAVLGWMFDYSESGWLLTGDFNALPDSSTIQTVMKRLHSAYQTIHGDHPHTFPTPLSSEFKPELALTLDYIFYDAERFRPTHAEIIANQPHPDDSTLYPSDHFGLLVDIN